MALDLAERTEYLDEVQRFVALAEVIARAGTIQESEVTDLLDECSVAARRYAEAIGLLADAGIDVVSDPIGDDSLEVDDNGAPVDGFGAFVRRSEHDLLDFEQEQALGRRISNGRMAAEVLSSSQLTDEQRRAFERAARDGKAAEDDLARHNIRLVMSIAKPLAHQCRSGMTYEDLVQEGWLGLSHAISKWDYARGLKFSTYATWWIRQAIDRAISNQARVIRLPVHFRDELRRVLRIEREFVERGEDPDIEVIAEKALLPPRTVQRALEWRHDARSLDQPIGGDGLRLIDLISQSSSVEEEAEANLLADDVHELLDDLTDRERLIITERFGLDGRPPRTLETIGQELGLTRERVRQIEARTLKALRHPSKTAHLRGPAGDC
jgi:RNA polymerase primary sigma factor